MVGGESLANPPLRNTACCDGRPFERRPLVIAVLFSRPVGNRHFSIYISSTAFFNYQSRIKKISVFRYQIFCLVDFVGVGFFSAVLSAHRFREPIRNQPETAESNRARAFLQTWALKSEFSTCKTDS
jgi:hypothetical protein